MNWAQFFPEGSHILAIPNWKQPRLFVASQSRGVRWKASALFPATTLLARTRRWLLRGLAQASGKTRQSHKPFFLRTNHLEIWGRNALPVAILLGTPGPAQKLVVQFADANGITAGYMKFGESPAAIRRLEQEFRVLTGLPKGMGPEALKLEKIGNGLGLFLSSVPGMPLPNRVLPCKQTTALLSSFRNSAETIRAFEHPWLRRVLSVNSEAAQRIETLDTRPWPVVFMHGDLAPWNILKGPEGLRCIDWEYGTHEGFIGNDAAYHILQTGFLLKNWTPTKARQKATAWLSEKIKLDPREAESLVRLTALMARHEASTDGHAASEPLQAWRYKVWSEL